MQIQNAMTPALLVDYDRLTQNINRMARKARSTSVLLRPHIKTHKCVEIAEIQRKAGICGITVSTAKEARVFSQHGFDDITLAVPLTHDKIEAILELSGKITFRVLLDHKETINTLKQKCKETGVDIDVLMKVDCGYHRAGVDPKSNHAIQVAQEIANAEHLNFEGILTHAGHAYNARSVAEIKQIAHQEQKVMVDFAKKLELVSTDLACGIVSIGSTPTCAVTDSFMEGITEIRPGNYVFYDNTQARLGVCDINEVSFSLLSSVTGCYSDHIIIDAGATALSKDLGATHFSESESYGNIYSNYVKGILNPKLRITTLSQEHGKVQGSRSAISHYKPGDKIRILPNHSCLTANLGDNLYIVRNNEITNNWKIWRGHLETQSISD